MNWNSLTMVFLGGAMLMGGFASCTSDVDSESGNKRVEIREVELTPATRGVAESIQPTFVKYTTDAIRYSLSSSHAPSKLVTSPLSATMLMALIANGVNDESRKEITDYLGTADIETLNELCKSLLTGLPEADNNVTLNMAHSIWVNTNLGFSPNHDYLSILDLYFNGDSFNFDFATEYDRLQNGLKKWYSDNTGGLITKPATGVLLNPTRTIALLLNSLYFKAPWVIFNPDKSKKAVFHEMDGDRMTDMMISNFIDDSPYYRDDEFDVFSLAFGGSAYALHIALPAEHLSLTEAVERFTPDFVKRVEEEMVKCRISVTMPKFTVDSELRLNAILGEAGVAKFMKGENYEMFNQTPTEDSYMDVWQNTSFGINEKGVEVTAVTIGNLGITSEYIKPGETYVINVDRPFIFYITEKSTKTWITSGYYAGQERR